MGKIFTTHEEVRKMVESKFGKTDNYLVVFKYNNPVKSIAKLFLNSLYAATDSARNFILYFDNQGIHEKEISFTDKSDFLLIPWNEIEDFEIKDKGNKIYLDINHLGKVYSYVIEFNDKLLKGNRERYQNLNKNHFYKN